MPRGNGITEHKQDGTAPSYYTDDAGRICDRYGTPFRDARNRRAKETK